MLRSRHRAVVQTPVTAVVPDMAFLSDGRMLKCASLCADDNVNTYAAAFHIKHAVSRSLLRAPQPKHHHHCHGLTHTWIMCLNSRLLCCVMMSTAGLTANASTWLAAIVRGDYAGITKRSSSAHLRPTRFNMAPVKIHPLCWRATLQHAWNGQPGMSKITLIYSYTSKNSVSSSVFCK